jgi:hypothetical protein
MMVGFMHGQINDPSGRIFTSTVNQFGQGINGND